MEGAWVTFDCFGTLVDWHGGFRRILQPLVGGAVERVREAYHAHERRLEAERPLRRYREILSDGLERAAGDAGCPLPGAFRSALADAWGQLPVFPDVEPLLAHLRQRGFQLAVLTNCDDDLFRETHRRFARPFDLVITAEQVGAYKPAPEHFRTFARRTGVAPDRWAHVACSWFHDMEPTRALGVRRVWWDRDVTGETPDPGVIRVTTAEGVQSALNGWPG